MNPEEVRMTEAESMQLISSMINKAKNRFNESGFLYLLWGWVVLICCLTQFVAAYFFNVEQAYYVWFLTWIIVGYQIVFLRKKRRSRNVKTYTDHINQFVWVVFFICLLLIVFILIQFKAYEAIDPAILVMYGMPTFLSGIILKFRPLLTGAAFCWLFAALSPLINPDFQLLLVGGGVIAGWIIPGYLLQQKFKNEN